MLQTDKCPNRENSNTARQTGGTVFMKERGNSPAVTPTSLLRLMEVGSSDSPQIQTPLVPHASRSTSSASTLLLLLQFW